MDNITKIYDILGMDYLLMTEEMRDIVLQSYNYNRKLDDKQLLMHLEKAIKSVYCSYIKNDNYAVDKKMHGEKQCLRILLEQRRRLMNKMFSLTEETYNQFFTINNTLLDLSNKVKAKALALYKAWLNDEEDEWRNDCQVSGRIFAESWEEKETDETGSDYCTMMDIIEEIGERNLYEIDFSGAPDIIPNSSTWKREFNVSTVLLFSEGGQQLFGDFTMCKAFYMLYKDSLYSHYDILRIKMYWADVAITHQRIVTPKGELL